MLCIADIALGCRRWNGLRGGSAEMSVRVALHPLTDPPGSSSGGDGGSMTFPQTRRQPAAHVQQPVQAAAAQQCFWAQKLPIRKTASPSPKSVMRTWPSLSSSTFSGFRSLQQSRKRGGC